MMFELFELLRNTLFVICLSFCYVTTNFEPTNEIISNSKSLTATTCKWEKLFEVFGTVLENQN